MNYLLITALLSTFCINIVFRNYNLILKNRFGKQLLKKCKIMKIGESKFSVLSMPNKLNVFCTIIFKFNKFK